MAFSQRQVLHALCAGHRPSEEVPSNSSTALPGENTGDGGFSLAVAAAVDRAANDGLSRSFAVGPKQLRRTEKEISLLQSPSAKCD